MNGVTNPSFTYDDDGNLLTGANRTLTWTSFNMPATISQGTATLTFSYDSEHARTKQVAPSGTTTYWNDPTTGAKAEYYVGSSTTQWNDYIFAAGGIVAIYYERTPGPNLTRYVHKDHLGSTAVITDETGTVVERDSYDTWGKRRYPNGNDDDGALATSLTDKGYTGQEQLEEVALVHMNGRIYDPQIGRFMSADPYVQDPLNTQDYNRYAYVTDNPLAYTDPSGYFSFGSIFKAITHIFNGVTNAGSKVFHNQFVQAAIQIAAASTGNYWYVASAAAFNTGVNGGDLGDMVKSAAIAAGTTYAFNKVGDWTDGHMLKDGTIGGKDPSEYFQSVQGIENIAGHAVVGCASSAAGGGSCGVGAFSAGMSSFAGPVIAGNNVQLGLVVSVAVGGTTTQLAGGKFANGAVTAAFGYLYNDLSNLNHTRDGLALGLAGGTIGSGVCDAGTAMVCTPVDPLIIGGGGIIGAIGGFIGDSIESGWNILFSKTPNTGEPGTWITNPGSGQQRLYGPDRKPLFDIDYDHDLGHGVPHGHDWTPSPTGGFPIRGPGRPLTPKDPTRSGGGE